MKKLPKSTGIFFSGFILLFYLLPSFLRAVTITSIAVSNSNPSPGSVVGVTVVYCENANTTPNWLVALNPNNTTFQGCPAANQVFLLDANTTPTGVGTVSGNQNDLSPPGNGWAGIAVD